MTMRKALLVAINLNNQTNFNKQVEECLNLCEAADIEIIQTITQSTNKLDPNTGIRSGKVLEVKEIVDANEDLEFVIFNSNLSFNIISNLEEQLEIDVMDRTNLILDIFSKRAKSKEAQIQTEMAQLKYGQRRIVKDKGNDGHMKGGGVNNRGAGEEKSELYKRLVDRRINELKRQLELLEERTDKEYEARNKTGVKKVALVGYSNAGKSSLMNCLLSINNKEEKVVYEKDQLFATLDTSARKIKYKNFEFVLFDTVGFVSNLPHTLIEAFKSTLKAVTNADLLIHVLDSSNEDNQTQKEITLETLKQIDASDIPTIEIYNKADLIENKNDGYLYVSSKTKEGIDELLNKIINHLYPNNVSEDILIPYSKLSLIDKFSKRIKYELVENN